ncbi:MAG: glycosyltransferase family 2 protein [Nitrospirae bacterium]|nr:MAG: glycosyltransferase family 2 protein [Nitrospirota bacterium]
MKVRGAIPLYNARDVILQTVRSVLDQTWRDFELVVVDDGSTDGAGDLIRTLDPRLRYLRQENAGVAAARNRGIAEAQGEAVALLDHDDLWHPTKLNGRSRCWTSGLG